MIHNVAGFAIPVALMATMLARAVALGSLGRRFDQASLLILAGVIGLFLISTSCALPYGLMELVCLGLIGAWLWSSRPASDT